MKCQKFICLFLILLFSGQSFAKNISCKIDFEAEPFLQALERVSKNSIHSDVIVQRNGDHYLMSYGNAEYVFEYESIEELDGFLKLSYFETFGANKILLWVIEIPLDLSDGNSQGMIYGESPWAILSCAHNEFLS